MTNTATETKHTPTPWRTGDKYPARIIGPANSRIVAQTTIEVDDVASEREIVDAAFIVRACNAHAELVQQVEWFCRSIEYYIERDKRDGDDEGMKLKQFTLKSAQNALAKARGEAI